MTTYRPWLYPRLSAPTSVPAMMMDVIVALLPALGMGIYLFGLQVLWQCLLSMTFCVLFQWLFCLTFRREKTYLDPSPWVTGMLLSFCYPASMPLWAIATGSFFAIVVVKELYGGLGCNFLNPALASRVFLATSPLLLTTFSQPRPMVEANLLDAMSHATPLASLKQGILPTSDVSELFMGFHGGSWGEVSSLVLVLGGIYLLLRRVITPTIPVSFLGTVALLAYFQAPDGISPTLWVICHLCSGGVILGAFFMATDPVTSPISFQAQLYYGIGCGVLTMFFRVYSSYPEGVGFAILFMNGLVWLLDTFAVPRQFGEMPFATFHKITTFLKTKLGAISFRRSRRGWIKTLFSKDFWKKIGKKITNFSLIRPSGTAVGEGYLDRLTDGAKCFLGYLVVFVLSVTAISVADHASSLARYRQEETALASQLADAMPQANFMSEMPYQSDLFHKVYLAFDHEIEIGYCIEVTVSGFVAPIDFLVGVDFQGAVTGIAVLSHQETLNVGSTALEPENLRRFVGKSGTVTEIDGISGATLTLEAVTMAVNRALESVQLLEQAGETGLLESVL